MPLIRRALKLLTDREVVPQLGLLKSTLLQLDSTFSERAYGVSSFRDFVQKLAKAGYVSLKGTDRSFHVELRDAGEAAGSVTPRSGRAAHLPTRRRPSTPRPLPPRGRRRPSSRCQAGARSRVAEAAERVERAAPAEGGDAPPRLGPVEGFRILQAAFTRPGVNPRWPMYVRQVKQFVRQVRRELRRAEVRLHRPGGRPALRPA